MREKGMTQKPCPGCGERVWRPINELCRNCKHDLARNRSIDKILKRDGFKIFGLGDVSHWNPGFYCKEAQIDTGIRDSLTDAFYELIKNVAKPIKLEGSDENCPSYDDPEILDTSKIREELKNSYMKMEGKIQVMTEHDISNSLTELFIAIHRALDDAYKHGYESGQNLLRQIASGELTVKKLNQLAIKEKSKN